LPSSDVLRAKHADHILHRLVEADMMIYLVTIWIIMRPQLSSWQKIPLLFVAAIILLLQWIRF